jgi:hypothetical protein
MSRADETRVTATGSQTESREALTARVTLQSNCADNPAVSSPRQFRLLSLGRIGGHSGLSDPSISPESGPASWCSSKVTTFCGMFPSECLRNAWPLQ